MRVRSAAEHCIDNVNHRLCVTDTSSGKRFLVDTGAYVSVLPPTKCQRHVSDSDNFKLYAANSLEIRTYGTRIELDIKLGKPLRWTFIIADVKQPIIGADLSRHYGLLVDLNAQQLLDRKNSLVTRGNIVKCAEPSVSIVDSNHQFHNLLSEYADITKLIPFRDDNAVLRLHDFTYILAGKKIFSKLDINKSYHHIKVAKEDIEKTAIITPFGLYASSA